MRKVLNFLSRFVSAHALDFIYGCYNPSPYRVRRYLCFDVGYYLADH